MEAAVKNTAEQDELGVDFFEDVNLKVMIPRRARMRDQVRKDSVFLYPEDAHKSCRCQMFPVRKPAVRAVSVEDQEGQDAAQQV